VTLAEATPCAATGVAGNASVQTNAPTIDNPVVLESFEIMLGLRLIEPTARPAEPI
jgi:hypothetical protein